MKRMRVSRDLLVFLFSITIMATGMYVPHRGIDSSFLRYFTVHTLSTVSSPNTNKIDAQNKRLETETDEIKESLSDGRDTRIFNTFLLKFLYSTAVLPYIPLISWIIFIILLRKKFVDRNYLILFIHNSDGKKGKKTVILTA